MVRVLPLRVLKNTKKNNCLFFYFYFLISKNSIYYIQKNTLYTPLMTGLDASSLEMVSNASRPFLVTRGLNPLSRVIPHRVGNNQNNGHGPKNCKITGIQKKIKKIKLEEKQRIFTILLSKQKNVSPFKNCYYFPFLSFSFVISS